MEYQFIIESLFSTLRIALIILPLLFIFDYLNHRYGNKIEATIKKGKGFMPLLGAAFGLIPGCNVAVITAVFYAQGSATLGTLLATLIATSDEALYVFMPLGFNFFPILIAKFILSLIAGYGIDYVSNKSKITNPIKAAGEIDFCCVQHPHNKTILKMIKHALIHGGRIIFIVFIVLLILNYLQDNISIDKLIPIFNNFEIFQPIMASLIGLIPGCGTSVGIATLYAKGVITFGAAVAGLSVASGEALIILISQGVKKEIVFKIALLLLIISSIYGTVIQLANITF